MNEAQSINIQLIDRPNPPIRSRFNEEEISALTESIRDRGILVPLLVRRTGERFEVIDGDCRLEAAFRLRIGEVPCVVRDSTDSETHVLRMLANLDRSDPDPVSEAIYISKVISSGALTLEEFAAKLKRSLDWLEDRLAIAEMPDYMQELLRTKKLSLGVALALVQVDNDVVRERWVNSAVIDGMSVRTAQDSLREYHRLKSIQARSGSDSPPPPMPEAPPVILYPCAKCGQHARLDDLRLVRIHISECSDQPQPSGAG